MSLLKKTQAFSGFKDKSSRKDYRLILHCIDRGGSDETKDYFLNHCQFFTAKVKRDFGFLGVFGVFAYFC